MIPPITPFFLLAAFAGLILAASIMVALCYLCIMVALCFGLDLDEDLEIGLSSHPVEDHGMQRQPLQKQLDEVSRPITVGTIVQYKKEEETESHCIDCVICLGEFKYGDSCRVLPNCKHVYHQLCIDQWLVKDTHCPLCRGSGFGTNTKSNH